MKLQKLEIKNIRGIPDLQIVPKGKSFVIYGPNGSGKSAVIDAIDFLLTGKIARLSGEGTEGVSLREHGPHIDKTGELNNVEVIAEITVPNVSESVSISRKMSKPNELAFDHRYEIQLSPILELLNRGQYVFTRREVLKLITAKSSTRAQEIQKVLKLSELEDIRTTLVKVLNEYKREYSGAQQAFDKAKLDVLAITDQEEYDAEKLLDFVNEQRIKLGGTKIEELQSEKLQEGITGVQVNPTSINHKTFSERIANLKLEELEKDIVNVVDADIDLRDLIKSIREDEQSNWNVKRYTFTKEGIELLRDTGECPLCDIEWQAGKLKEHLQERVDSERERQAKLANYCKTIISSANSIKTKIQQVTELVQSVSESEEAIKSTVFTTRYQELRNWSDKLISLISALADPMKDYEDEEFPSEDVTMLYAPDNLNIAVEEFKKEVLVLFPEASPEQTAWDLLIKLVERLRNFEESISAFESAEVVYNRSLDLEQAYVSARDEILEGLYEKIKSRFVGLYKEMHGADENGFDANFSPQDAGLNLEVDFYGRGLHPPHALHSEGHQDSMGVCLFLALSEHLNTGLIELIILDDVVMSVDSGHRRAFCSVLANNFSNNQLIITTHDTTWANQLRGEGIVNRKQMLKFFNWSVDAGPGVLYEADLWNKIEDDLLKDDVSAAAAKLRKGLEEYSRFVCHNLRARVPYILDDGGTLGDFLPPAIGAFNDLIGKSKKCANSWNRQDIVVYLNKRHDHAREIIKRTQVEEWTINKAVHYNEWANFRKEDFAPVVVAFHELCDKVFACDKEGCDSVLKVTFDGATMNGVRCKCGAVNWNLIMK